MAVPKQRLQKITSASSSIAALLAVLVLAIPSLGAILNVPGPPLYLPVLFVFLLLAFYRSSRPDGPRIPRPVLFYAAMFTVLFWWLLITSLWTEVPAQSHSDMMLLLLQIVLLLALTFSFSYESARKLLTYSCAASAVLGLYLISGYLIAGDYGYEGVLRENYLVLATAVGIGAVGATLRFVAYRGARWLWGVAALLLLLALALSLARGALLSSIFVIVLFTVLAVVVQPSTGPILRGWRGGMVRVGLVLAALSLSVVLAFRVDFFRGKLEELLAGEIGLRRDIWKRALSNLESAGLFGHGLGSSGLLSERVESGYPHNLFLQVWLDGGLTGMLLMLVIALLPFAPVVLRLVRRQFTGLSWLPLLGIYLFVLLEYSKSFNFYTARALLVFGVAALWLLSAEGHINERDASRQGARVRLADIEPVDFKDWR